MTAVAGAGVGYLAARGLRGGAPRAAACLAAAMAMHLLFDAPAPGAAILLKVAAQLRVVLVFYLKLRRGYRARARAALARHVAAGAVPGVEAPALLARRSRRRRQRRVPAGPSALRSSPVNWPTWPASSGKRPTDEAPRGRLSGRPRLATGTPRRGRLPGAGIGCTMEV